MIGFELHTTKSAPHGARPLLRQLHQEFGFVPSLFAKLAESDTALAAYLELRSRFERSSLDPIEQQVVCLAVSVENKSPFCVSAHSLAARHSGMSEEDLEALREQRDLPSPKLDALARFARTLVRERGAVDDGDINVMLAAGYTPRQLADVVLGVALKMFSNFTAHLVHAPLNAELLSERWTPRETNWSWTDRIFGIAAQDPDCTQRNPSH